MELDKRLKKSLLGDENYKLGDATKRTISQAVANYTGKGVCRDMIAAWAIFNYTFLPHILSKIIVWPDSYEFGDVTKKVVSTFAEDNVKVKDDRPMIGMKTAKDMEPSIVDALGKSKKLIKA